MVCFVHFDLEICVAPQWRALFRHLNFQKWSEAEVFCTFSLGNVLRATTACTFSTSQLPKVVRTWCVLYILTWKYASRHNGVHFLDIATSKSGPKLRCFVHFYLQMCFGPQRRAIFHLSSASWLRTRRFSEPTFDPPEPQIIGKTQCFATFLPFAHLHLLSSTLSLLLFFLLIFSSLCLFPALLFICPYCRKFDF